MGMLLISKDWGTFQARRDNGWSKMKKNPRGKPAALGKKVKLGWKFPFQHDNDPKHTAKAILEWLRNKNINVHELAQSEPRPKCNRKYVAWHGMAIENMWRGMAWQSKIRSPRNLTELE